VITSQVVSDSIGRQSSSVPRICSAFSSGGRTVDSCDDGRAAGGFVAGAAANEYANGESNAAAAVVEKLRRRMRE